MHGGGSDLAAGLNHVMRAPRGSESLPEKIDFTPKGNGVWRGRERRKGRVKRRLASTGHCYTCKCGKEITKIPLSAPRTQSQTRVQEQPLSSLSRSAYLRALTNRSFFQKQIYAAPIIHVFHSSLDQDTTGRAERGDGEPRDAVKIPGKQSPRVRSSPSKLGGKLVLSCTDRKPNVE